MFPRKAFLGTTGNTGVCTDIASICQNRRALPCDSHTSEDAWQVADAYAFLAHEQKNLACIFTVRAVTPCPGLPRSRFRQMACCPFDEVAGAFAPSLVEVGKNPVLFHVFFFFFLITGMTDCLVRLWPQIFIQYSTLDRFHGRLADICEIVSRTGKISER